MTTDSQEVKSFIKRLRDSFNDTMDLLIDMPQAQLDAPCGHGCARGGTARDLLIHNIFHEKQHSGQVWSIRDQLNILQGWNKQDLPLLLADYYTARAQLIASLFGLTDEQIDTQPPDEGWTIRQTLEHVLYWDQDSMQALAAEIDEAAG